MIAFIVSIKATVTIAYSDELRLTLRVLFIRIKILPSKEPKKKRGMSERKARKIREAIKKKEQKKALAKKEKSESKKEKEKKSVSETISLVKLLTSVALTVIKTFFGHLKIKMTRIKMVVATEDAATTAVAYGAITQSINILLPALESVENFNLRRADIDVRPDFLSDEMKFDVKISFSIRVWHILHVGFAALIKFIKGKLAQDFAKQNASETTNEENKKININ